MRIEIMIDKEQKISQATWTLLNPSFTEIAPSVSQNSHSYSKGKRQRC
jgi:hypothetical protein